MKREHQAVRHVDEYQCHVCGKSWGIKNPNPPECISQKEYGKKRIKEIKEELHS